MRLLLCLVMLAIAGTVVGHGAGPVYSVVELDQWRTHRFPPIPRPAPRSSGDDETLHSPLLQLRLTLEPVSGDADLFVADCDEAPARVAAGEYLAYSFAHGADHVLLDLYSAKSESTFWETTCAFVLGKSNTQAHYLLELDIVEQYTDKVVQDLGLEFDESSWLNNEYDLGSTTEDKGRMSWLDIAQKVLFFVVELLA